VATLRCRHGEKMRADLKNPSVPIHMSMSLFLLHSNEKITVTIGKHLLHVLAKLQPRRAENQK
jgi:hypothetical protein